MRRLLLHLLLVFSLVFNVAAAPWAMARMSHDGHGHGGAGAGAVAEVPHDTSHASMHHAMGHNHSAVASAAPSAPHATAPVAGSDDACCNGARCQCGCILPPAAGIVAATALALPSAGALDDVPATLPTAARGSPPFRPPAA